MKTITETGTISTYSTEVICGFLDNGKVNNKKLRINVLVDGSNDYKVANQIDLVDWMQSMLNNVVIVPVTSTVTFPDCIRVMQVESDDIDYVLLTLLLILKKLNTDESVTFNAIQYEES